MTVERADRVQTLLILPRSSNSEQPNEGYTLISDFTNGAPEPCEFCDPPLEGEPLSAFDICLPLGDIALKPALGSLEQPGYFLGVTQAHVTSFAQLSPPQLEVVDATFNILEGICRKKISHDGLVRFEHGSDNVESCGIGAGACVTHAHQHLLPAEKAVAKMQDALDWQDIGSFANLADFRGNPYLYMGYDNHNFVAPQPRLRSGARLPSQWGRRVIAEVYEREVYDWALHNGAGEIAFTMHRIGMLPRGKFTLDLTRDQMTFDPHVVLPPTLYAAIDILAATGDETTFPSSVQVLLDIFRDH